MTVRLDGDRVLVEADCVVEDAETLAALLEADPARRVDLSQCRHMHGAVLQALLYYAPHLTGSPQDPFLRDWVLPLLSEDRQKDRGATK